MKHNRNKGVSQTEYIIILALVGITSLLVVGNLGVKIKTLFKKSKAELSFENTDYSDHSNQENDNSTPTMVNLTNEDEDEDKDNNNDEDNTMSEECQQQHNNLMNQKQEQEKYFNNLINEYNKSADFYKQQALAYIQSSFWGWISFGHHHHHHHASTNNKVKRCLLIAQFYQDKANNAQNALNNFLANWQQQMNEWKQNCQN